MHDAFVLVTDDQTRDQLSDQRQVADHHGVVSPFLGGTGYRVGRIARFEAIERLLDKAAGA